MDILNLQTVAGIRIYRYTCLENRMRDGMKRKMQRMMHQLTRMIMLSAQSAEGSSTKVKKISLTVIAEKAIV